MAEAIGRDTDLYTVSQQNMVRQDDLPGSLSAMVVKQNVGAFQAAIPG